MNTTGTLIPDRVHVELNTSRGSIIFFILYRRLEWRTEYGKGKLSGIYIWLAESFRIEWINMSKRDWFPGWIYYRNIPVGMKMKNYDINEAIFTKLIKMYSVVLYFAWFMRKSSHVTISRRLHVSLAHCQAKCNLSQWRVSCYSLFGFMFLTPYSN